MKKVITLLFVFMAIFSSCSAKGYWTAAEPVARADGAYHLIDLPAPVGDEEYLLSIPYGAFHVNFYLGRLMCSDDGDEIIIPTRFVRVTHIGYEHLFALLKYRYSTRKVNYVILKTFVSPDKMPNESDWREFKLSRGVDACCWLEVVEGAKGAILKVWMAMAKKNMLKRYEFVED